MTVSTSRRLPESVPELVGRASEDSAEELERFLEWVKDSVYGGLPAGFNEISPTTVDGVTAADPGLEADGWASATHQHAADVSGAPGNVTAAASAQGGGPGFSLSGHTHGIDDDAITLPKITDIPDDTVLGNVSGASASPVALTPAEVTLNIVNLFTALLKGAVPASGGGTTNFLRADGTWAAPGGGGGGGSWTEVEIDFGTTPVYDATFVITDAAITGPTVQVVLVPCGKAATGRTADDWQWDGGTFVANPGTGSAVCYAVFTPGPIVGPRKLQYQVV